MAAETRCYVAVRSIARSTDERTTISTILPPVGISARATVVAPRLATGSEVDHELEESANANHDHDSQGSSKPQRSSGSHAWIMPARKTTNATNERTCIDSFAQRAGISDRAPIMHFRSSPVLKALMLANTNSIVLDYAARCSVGGTDLGHYILRQLPVLAPEAYAQTLPNGLTYADLVLPRVIELMYTSEGLREFAAELGYDGDPFEWDEDRRHITKCELDAVFAHMYQLDRQDVEHILDPAPPAITFSGLKAKEMREFGEYRTKRYVLAAFDVLASGDYPCIYAQ